MAAYAYGNNTQRKFFLNLAKSYEIWIVFTLCRLTWHQKEFYFFQSVNCNYNPNLVWLNKMQKREISSSDINFVKKMTGTNLPALSAQHRFFLNVLSTNCVYYTSYTTQLFYHTLYFIKWMNKLFVYIYK